MLEAVSANPLLCPLGNLHAGTNVPSLDVALDGTAPEMKWGRQPAA